MRQQKTVKVPAVKASTKEVTVVYCDIPECNAKVTIENYGGGGGVCEICKRDVCKKHKVRDYHDGGDYANNYCTICWPIYEPLREKMEERHWDEEEELIEKVKKESLNERSTESRTS